MHAMLYLMSIDTETVVLSSKYQLVIPSRVRKLLKLRPGARIQVMEHNGRIELIPLRSIEETRGFLGPIDTDVERDDDRV